MSSSFDHEAITQILRFDSLPSTNLEAAARAIEGADEGLCIVAGEQTAGRDVSAGNGVPHQAREFILAWCFDQSSIKRSGR